MCQWSLDRLQSTIHTFIELGHPCLLDQDQTELDIWIVQSQRIGYLLNYDSYTRH